MRGTKRLLLILAAAIAVSGSFLLNVPAVHAASWHQAKSTGSPFEGFSPRDCGGIQIHLTGQDKFTVHCLPKRQLTKGSGVSPLTNENSDGTCYSSDIAMHLNINYDDRIPWSLDYLYPLCINGAGSISNFQNIIACEVHLGLCSNDCVLYDCIDGPDSWNDIASSFTTGAWYGRIYSDANRSGAWAQFSPNESCANMTHMAYSYTSGPLNFNDVVSSIWVGGTYSEGPIVC